MAIIINIYYTGIDGNAKKFAEEMVSSGVVDDIRAESGNIRYDYFLPMDDKETVLLIDSWENQQSIDIHHESPMMQQIIRLREKYDLAMKVERYVTDEMGIPSSDKKYIRD
jgi:quinol monooxygenase YgiN